MQTTPAWKSRPRGWRLLLGSTIGKKAIMGITGAIMVGWLLLHTFGNTLLYAGSEPLPFVDMSSMDFYGWVIQEGSHGAVWGLRFVMLMAIVLHVWSALALTKVNSDARPQGYQHGLQRNATNYAALTMRYGGVVLLLFLIYHLLHMTIGVAPIHPDFHHGAVYHNMVTGLANPVVAGIYIAANMALGLHLYHGIWSGMQTLGFNHPQYNDMRRTFAFFVALAIAGTNISFPLSILLGIVS